ncbi:MAG: hypothetical protein QOE10_1203, partial [Gaiellales bacterium]|nr:hypothetical protein [Gaiellales bacterium]
PDAAGLRAGAQVTQSAARAKMKGGLRMRAGSLAV